MSDLERNIIRILEKNPGFSDLELTAVVAGSGEPTKYVNQNCRTLVTKGVIIRKKREDGLIGNWLKDEYHNLNLVETVNPADQLSEKKIKQILEIYLNSLGWQTKIAWGFTHGIDIEACSGKQRWIIEVKGCETENLLPVNLFVAVIGEAIQRMDESRCKYSIALPDIDQFRRLWYRLPALAKEKTGLSALLVSREGRVTEVLA